MVSVKVYRKAGHRYRIGTIPAYGAFAVYLWKRKRLDLINYTFRNSYTYLHASLEQLYPQADHKIFRQLWNKGSTWH
jgi:hypothetical protein